MGNSETQFSLVYSVVISVCVHGVRQLWGYWLFWYFLHVFIIFLILISSPPLPE